MNLLRQTYFSVSSEGVPIRNIADYSPFGVQLDGRTIQGDFYRFGYQGSEKDDETKGGGNSYTTQFRILDPRIGRWFSIDPMPEADISPYTSMDNNPTKLNDILGLYTEKGAERRAARGRRHGYQTKVLEKNGNFGVYYEKTRRGKKHFETYFDGKFRGARKSNASVQAEAVEIISTITDGLNEKLSQVNDYWNSINLVFDAEGKVTAGANVKLKSGLFESELNVASIELINLKADLTNPKNIKVDHVGKNGTVFTQGASLMFSLPFKSTNNSKIQFGGEFKREFRGHNGGYTDLNDEYKCAFALPIIDSKNDRDIVQKVTEKVYSSIMKKPGSTSTFKTEKSNKDNFVGFEFEIGAAFIIGGELKIKCGYEKD